MISRSVRNHSRLLASLAGAVAVVVALSIHAVYGSGTADDDIKDSCKDFSVSADGVLSATCNVWTNKAVVFGTRNHTIDLDEKVGFDGSALQYDQKDFSGKCDSETVSFGSDQLTLKANCPSGAGGTTVSIRIDDMIWNEGREFGGYTIGLHWRTRRWSD